MELKIKVTQREISILREIYEDYSFDYIFKVDDRYVSFQQQYLEDIIDTISDYFIKHGLDRKDEPTQFGLEIEDLQSKFLEVLWSLET